MKGLNEKEKSKRYFLKFMASILLSFFSIITQHKVSDRFIEDSSKAISSKHKISDELNKMKSCSSCIIDYINSIASMNLFRTNAIIYQVEMPT